MMIRIMPSQNSGIAWPMKDNVVAVMSNMEYCFTAETIPMGMAMEGEIGGRLLESVKRLSGLGDMPEHFAG